MSGLATIQQNEMDPPESLVQWQEVISVHSFAPLWKIYAMIGVLKAASLPNDWDSYGSPAPLQLVVETALKLIKSIPFDDLPVPCVVPISGAGLQIEWSVSRKELELEILPDCSIEFLKVERREPIDEGKFATADPLMIRPLLVWLIS